LVLRMIRKQPRGHEIFAWIGAATNLIIPDVFTHGAYGIGCGNEVERLAVSAYPCVVSYLISIHCTNLTESRGRDEVEPMVLGGALRPKAQSLIDEEVEEGLGDSRDEA
jgi:hypothetical protein